MKAWFLFFVSIPLAQGWIVSRRPLRSNAFGWPRAASTTTIGSAAAGGSSAAAAAADDKGAPKPSLVQGLAGLTQASCLLLGVRSIGVDYGLVRTGLAKTSGYAPEPMEIIVDVNATQVAQRVVQVAQGEGNIDKLIVGLPLHKNGTVAEQTNISTAFAAVLAEASLRTLGPGVAVELWDERYTSKEAAARAHARDPHRFLYGTLDAEAACIILEQYYADNGEGAVLATLPDATVREACRVDYQERQDAVVAQQQASLDERDRVMQRRRDAILRDRQQEQENSEDVGTKKRKKKKKKKR
jgi:putative transcription antitermination factor YqgF